MPSCADLPPNVKGLFPKENLEYAESITPEEATILQEVFSEHGCFEQVGEMIEATEKKSPELGRRMREVLEGNKKRLEGLSPAAIELSKKIIDFVTHVQCQFTLGKTVCLEKADQLHKEFQALSQDDQEAMRKNNPDLNF